MRNMLVVETHNGFVLIPNVTLSGQHDLAECRIANTIDSYSDSKVVNVLNEFFKKPEATPESVGF